MHRLAWFVPLIVSATAAADPDQDRVLAAIKKRDVAALERLAPKGISVTDFGWYDAGCAKRFGGVRTVERDELRALVDCLARLGLALGRGGDLVFEPGARVSANLFEGQLSLFSSSAGTPPVPLMFENLPLAFEPDADTRAAIASSRTDVAWADVIVCFDAKGRAESSKLLESSHHAGYERAAIDAAGKATHAPFKAHGNAVRACISMEAQYPHDRLRPGKHIAITPKKKVKIKDIVQPVKIEKRDPAENEVEGGGVGGDDMVNGIPPPPPPPPPPAPPRNIPPTLLEPNRIAGKKELVPDADTRAKIIADGRSKVVGSWKLCVDTTGQPSVVMRLKSTGYPSYDDEIAAGIRTWRYRSYEIDGKPAAVCTAVTFIYAAQ